MPQSTSSSMANNCGGEDTCGCYHDRESVLDRVLKWTKGRQISRSAQERERYRIVIYSAEDSDESQAGPSINNASLRDPNHNPNADDSKIAHHRLTDQRRDIGRIGKRKQDKDAADGERGEGVR